MWRDRASRGLALRVGALITVLLVCVHVYLERGRKGAPPPLPQRPPSPTSLALQERGAHTRGGRPVDKQGDRELKRRVSYVRTLKKDPEAGRKAGGSEDPTATCCPHLGPHKKTTRWHIDLEPWAGETHSLEDEARRFLKYITTPQVSCVPPASGGAVLETSQEGPWAVCLDSKYSLAHKIHSKPCRVYSLGLGVAERILEHSLGGAGCEVHCFDPSLRQPHLQQGNMWLHKLSVDWRDPNPAISAQRHHGNTKKLATILNNFGHRQVDVLKADMESAEWKILENLILEGVLDSVGQLLLELHLHWAGFEVGGDDPSVVRYWFSLLKELERAHFRLFRSYRDPTKPLLFLHKNVLNASSAYTLGWVNTQWRH